MNIDTVRIYLVSFADQSYEPDSILHAVAVPSVEVLGKQDESWECPCRKVGIIWQPASRKIAGLKMNIAAVQ